jgi:uncharacterized RDD family membrane protein YckC
VPSPYQAFEEATVVLGDRHCKHPFPPIDDPISDGLFRAEKDVAPPVPPRVAPPVPRPLPVARGDRPAGFWRRFIALLVDGLVLWAAIYLLDSCTIWLMNRAIESAVVDAQGHQLHDIIARYDLGNLLATVLLLWIYFAGLEASPLRGTPGKRLLRVQVTDARGKRLALWRSTIRWLAKALSAALFMIGFLMAGLNRRRRALHDLISGSFAVVVRKA